MIGGQPRQHGAVLGDDVRGAVHPADPHIASEPRQKLVRSRGSAALGRGHDQDVHRFPHHLVQSGQSGDPVELAAVSRGVDTEDRGKRVRHGPSCEDGQRRLFLGRPDRIVYSDMTMAVIAIGLGLLIIIYANILDRKYLKNREKRYTQKVKHEIYKLMKISSWPAGKVLKAGSEIDLGIFLFCLFVIVIGPILIYNEIMLNPVNCSLTISSISNRYSAICVIMSPPYRI